MKKLKQDLGKIIEKLRLSLENIEIVDMTSLTSKMQYKQLEQIKKERKPITEALKKVPVEKYEWTLNLHHPKSQVPRYEIEYRTADELGTFVGIPANFSGTHYWFYSPILEESVLDTISQSENGDNDSSIFPSMKQRINERVLDVGCGNGQFLSRLAMLGIPKSNLRGEDLSFQSRIRIWNMGIQSGSTRIDQIDWRSTRFGMVFLSYFIDRDSDQKRTLEASTRILRKGGLLIIEGLFPCVLSDSNGNSYGSANVTKGDDAVEDIGCVIEECKKNQTIIKKIIVGERLVYSLDGAEVLPSYILVFQKTRE